MTSNILIGDSQFLSRSGLVSILSRDNDVKIVGTAASNESLEEQLKNKKVDVVIIDYSNESAFGSEAISIIKETSPFSKILAISNDNNRQRIYDVIERGVNSYVTKYCSEEEVKTAIKSTIRGEKFFCNKVLEIILEKSFGKKEEVSPLSPREMEIVQHIAQGKVAKEISDMLHISVHTIYTHRKNIMRKLELSSPVELVMYAVNNGLVDLD